MYQAGFLTRLSSRCLTFSQKWVCNGFSRQCSLLTVAGPFRFCTWFPFIRFSSALATAICNSRYHYSLFVIFLSRLIFIYYFSHCFILLSQEVHNFLLYCIYMMPGSKAWNHDVLAQEWFYGLMTRPDMSIKVERKLHDMRILGRIVGVRSTEQFVWHLLIPTSYTLYIKIFDISTN